MKIKKYTFDQDLVETVRNVFREENISLGKSTETNLFQRIRAAEINKTMKGVNKLSRLLDREFPAHGLFGPVKKVFLNKMTKELRFQVSEFRFVEVKKWIRDNSIESISPEFLAKQQTRFYCHANYCYKKVDGKTDWEFIAHKLGAQDQFKVQILESYMGDKKKILNQLRSLLEDEKPEKWGPQWLRKNGKGIGAQIEKYFRTKEETVDWQSVIALLPLKWRRKWIIEHHRKELATNIVSIVASVEGKIFKENVLQFSPSWLQKNMPKDYKILMRRLIRHKGSVARWHVLSDLFSDDLRKRWRRHRIFLKEKMPERFYENKKEVQDVLNEYHDDLLLLYREGRIPRKNYFISQMILLIQKGNIAATECFADHVEFRVQWLMGHRKDLVPWQFDSGGLRRKIVECAIKCERPDSFFPYLFVTLQKSAPHFWKKGTHKTKRFTT